MANHRYWIVGWLLVLIWLVLDHIVGLFGLALGLTENAQLFLLSIPALASFLVTVQPAEGSNFRALMFVPPIAFLGPVLILIGGAVWKRTDFTGIAALPSTVTIYLIEGFVAIIGGILAGVLWKKCRR